MRDKTFHVTARTRRGSTIVYDFKAEDMHDALKEVSNKVLKGEHQCQADYSNTVKLEIYEVPSREGV